MTVRAIAALVAALTLVGCGDGGTSSSTTATSASAASAPTAPAAATSPAAPLPSCGDVPVSNGISKDLIGATATGPATAQAGSTVTVQVHLTSLDGKPHTFDSGAAPVLILQDGRVVGEYKGAVAAYGTEQKVMPGVANSTDASVLLSGCPGDPLDVSAPDLTRKPLPPGAYQLVVDLPDLTDKPFGNLMSTPITLQVTAYPSTLPTCGDVPVSNGPSADTIGAQLTAAATAEAGSTVHVQVLLRSYRGKPEPFESGLPIDVLVVRDGFVVGRSDGPIAGVGVVRTVPASGTVPMIDSSDAGNKLFNSDVTLSGCPDTSVAQPSGTAGPSPRKALPPGTYQLVGALEDDHDGTLGTLVTEPTTITVTAG